MPYGYSASLGVTVGTPAGYQSNCLPCPGGHYCLNATVVPVECGQGYYTKPGQSVCQECLPGRFCSSNSTTEANMNATMQCPAGKYCKGGLKDVAEATPCSTAHYCPQGKNKGHSWERIKYFEDVAGVGEGGGEDYILPLRRRKPGGPQAF